MHYPNGSVKKSKLLPVIAIAVSCGLTLAGCTDLGAWDTERGFGVDGFDWQYRLPLTFNPTGTTGAETNIPIMVRIPAGILPTGSVNSHGTNLAFFAAPYQASSKPLPHTFSVWEPLGESIAWVRLDAFEEGVTRQIWLYWGGEDAEVAQRPDEVWSEGYRVVMHFEDTDGEGTFSDTSGNGNHSINSPYHTLPSSAAGSAGRSALFDTNSDAVIIPDSASIRTMAPITAVFLFNPSAAVDNARFLSKGDWYLSQDTSGSYQWKAEFQFGNPSGPAPYLLKEWAAPLPTVGLWTSVFLEFEGLNDFNTLRLYTDNTISGIFNQGNDGDAGPQDDDSAKWLAVGNAEFTGATRAVDGRIDELRIAESLRSATWRTVEYLSMTDQLVTRGSRERLD